MADQKASQNLGKAPSATLPSAVRTYAGPMQV